MSKITSFKGFDANLSCRGFQFKLGETFTHEGRVKACEGGFHACEYPLDVLNFYPAATSRFCEVEQDGTLDKDGDHTKIASSKLTLKAEIGLPGLIAAAVKYTLSRCKPVDPASPASNSGYGGAASNSGYGGAASNSGDNGAASNSGPRGAASNSGYGGAASNSGYGGAAMNAGRDGRVKGCKGSALFLVQRDIDDKILHVWAGIVGKDGIEPDVWYTLKAGKPVVWEG